MKIGIGFLVLALMSLVCLADDENARLLASKSILNEMLIEDKDVTVEYNIFNVGGSVALNVELRDDSFDTNMFQVVQGSTHSKWPRLAPGTNVSHSIIVKPLKAGIVNFTSAEIQYTTGEQNLKKVGYTSAPGEDRVMNFREFDRRFSPHVTDWVVFGLMTLPSLGMPLLLWFKSKSKYDDHTKSK